jgi:hypothetical protein
MQNLMMSNSNLMNQVVQTLESGRNDSKIDMPPIEVNNEPEPQYQQSSSNDDGLSVWGVIKFLIGIVALLANIAQCAN